MAEEVKEVRAGLSKVLEDDQVDAVMAALEAGRIPHVSIDYVGTS